MGNSWSQRDNACIIDRYLISRIRKGHLSPAIPKEGIQCIPIDDIVKRLQIVGIDALLFGYSCDDRFTKGHVGAGLS